MQSLTFLVLGVTFLPALMEVQVGPPRTLSLTPPPLQKGDCSVLQLTKKDVAEVSQKTGLTRCRVSEDPHSAVDRTCSRLVKKVRNTLLIGGSHNTDGFVRQQFEKVLGQSSKTITDAQYQDWLCSFIDSRASWWTLKGSRKVYTGIDKIAVYALGTCVDLKVIPYDCDAVSCMGRVG